MNWEIFNETDENAGSDIICLQTVLLRAEIAHSRVSQTKLAHMHIYTSKCSLINVEI